MQQNDNGEWEVDKEKCRFTDVYSELKLKLMDKGIPSHEIAFIHDAKSDAQRDALFEKVRTGDIRVLIGSTEKMGAGTNVQDKVIALHRMDVPWKPSDITQSEGRGIRRGNENPEVEIYRYITKGTFDAYSYQVVENKRKFIGQVMTSKNPARSCEDIDEQALDYAEIKALATGNPLMQEKMNLERDIRKLEILKNDHYAQQYRMEDELARGIPQDIQKTRLSIQRLESTKATLDANPISGMKIEIGGKVYDKHKKAGEQILAMCLADTVPKGVIGTYRGFEMRLEHDAWDNHFNIVLRNGQNGAAVTAQVSENPVTNITRIEDGVKSIPGMLDGKRLELDGLKKKEQDNREALKNPFSYGSDLEKKESRLIVLKQELAEAAKEHAAKRALRKAAKEQAAQNSAQQGEKKSITGFIQGFKPAPVSSTPAKQQSLERV